MPVIKRKAIASPAASDHEQEPLEIEQPLDQVDHAQSSRRRTNLSASSLQSFESVVRHLPLDLLESLLPLQKRRCLNTLVGGLPAPLTDQTPVASTSSHARAEDDASVFIDASHREKYSARAGKQAGACVGLEEEWHTLHSMLHATVTAQESNSCLLIGASGSGKSLLVDSVLHHISTSVSPSKKDCDETNSSETPFYHVHLAGTVQINDRSAMKEMAQQLILQGAFTEDDVGEAIDSQSLSDDEEQGPQTSTATADRVFGGDADDEDDDDAGSRAADLAAEEQAEVQDELAGAILSSLNNIIAHIIALLSNTASSSASNSTAAAKGGRKPLIITLDDFDLFTARPRQAMLYCLLDAVQAASYGAGLALVGLTTRVDTVDLLEKRVKSRFSHRILHVRSPSSYQMFERIVQNALSPLSIGASDSISGSVTEEQRQSFVQAWQKDVTTLFSHPHFREVLRGIHELSNDVRMVYRVLIPAVARLSVLDPVFDLESLLVTAAIEVVDGMLHVLRDLTEPEMALLISVKHLQTRDRQVFNFEMCFDELRRFAARDARERQAASTGTSLISTNTTNGENGSLSGSAISTPFYADRKIALMAFHTLLNLEILLPENYVSTLSISNPVAKPSAAPLASVQTGRANQNTIRKEFWKVRSILSPHVILQAVKDRHRNIPITSSLVKWASSHG